MIKRKYSKHAHEQRYLEIGQAVWQHYRMRCYTHLSQAIRYGHIPSLPDGVTKCGYCLSRTASGWEHRDYMDPLKVTPVCAKCNATLPPAHLDTSVVTLHSGGWPKGKKRGPRVNKS
jgi:hypothetical protein